jgi:hypothetical protein
VLKKIFQPCFFRFFILLFCLTPPPILYCQGQSEPTPDFTKSTVLKFERISTGQGLSNTAVNTIFQDSRGYMWFGEVRGQTRREEKRTFNFLSFNQNPLIVILKQHNPLI